MEGNDSAHKAETNGRSRLLDAHTVLEVSRARLRRCRLVADVWADARKALVDLLTLPPREADEDDEQNQNPQGHPNKQVRE